MTRTPPHSRLILLALAASALLLVLGAPSAQAAYTINRVGTELQLSGDDASDTVRIDRDAAGVLRVDVDQDGDFDHVGSSTVLNTTRIVVDAAGGDDTVTISETNGALPAATVGAGAGADSITTGSGGDLVSGGPGADVVLSRGGADQVIGGDDGDTITGGDADDSITAGLGDDTSIWNPGDDSDTLAAGPGRDTEQVNGGGGAEIFAVARNAAVTGVLFSRLDPAPFTVDAVDLEQIQLRENGGDDSFTANNDLAGFVEAIEVDPGTGSAQPVNGSDISDTVLAGAGTFQFAGEDGDDAYRWEPGDGNGDSVDLGGGSDVVSVTGTDAAEQFAAEPIGATLRVTSDALSFSIDVLGANTLAIDARAGGDLFTAAPALGDLVASDVSGGGDNDILVGSNGVDTLRGGDGDDTITALAGNDSLFGDAGTDTLGGGAGADSFACGGFGDAFDATPEDSVAADCLRPADPVVQQPDTGGGEDLAVGFKGFSQPRVRGRTGDLVVTVANTHSAPITLRFGGSETVKGAARAFRYRAVTRTVAPGARVKVVLRAPARLSRKLRRTLARRGRIVRRPRVNVTNVPTTGRTSVRPRIVVKAR